MKFTNLLLPVLILFGLESFAQNNIFPTTGNVGIGTTSPAKKLDVIGPAKVDEINFPLVQYNLTSAPRTQLGAMSIRLFDDYVSFRTGGTPPGGNNYGTLLAMYGRASHWENNIYFGADRKMYFRISAYAEHSSENGKGNFNNWRTVLDSHSDVKSSGLLQLSGSGNHFIQNGNLGIGTITPSEKLSVNGKIRAQEVKVETANWPDYVFEPDYILPSLKETETFIKTNRHLPDMPNAQEVEANGVALGEMNRLLLQKVEELTLHLIEKDKQLEAFAKRLSALESKN